MCRTTPGIADAMNKLEDLIRNKLMPVIIGVNEISDEMRSLLYLPARMGGMGFLNPSCEANLEFENSVAASAKLADAIYDQQQQFTVDEEAQEKIKEGIRNKKEQRWKNLKVETEALLSDHMKRIMSLASEKGAST